MISYVKKTRIEKNMTQEELAYKTGVSLSQIRNIENNRSIPSILLALKIKQALNVENIEDLFQLD